MGSSTNGLAENVQGIAAVAIAFAMQYAGLGAMILATAVAFHGRISSLGMLCGSIWAVNAALCWVSFCDGYQQSGWYVLIAIVGFMFSLAAIVLVPEDEQDNANPPAAA